MSTDRNYQIALARIRGEMPSQIASKHGITRSQASNIATKYAWMVARSDGRTIPHGLTVRATIAIHDAIGLWPSEEDKAEVEKRAMEIFRSLGGRRNIMRDIGDWLGIAGNSF